MDFEPRTSASWTRAAFSPAPHQRQDVAIAGIGDSDIVRAALTDPALQRRVAVRYERDRAPPHGIILWRCETAEGEPLHRAVERAWHRPPYALTVRLMQYAPGQERPEILDEGTIGTRGPKRAYRTAVDRLAMRFVRDAALGVGRGASGVAPAKPAHGMPGPLQYRRARWRERLLTEWWSLGHAEAGFDALLGGAGLGKVRWLRPAAGTHYLADPFPWHGRGLLLAEEMPVHGGPGRIVAVRPGEETVGPTILADGEHHSYPCTLREGEAEYCVPETTRRGGTRIFRLGTDGHLALVAEPAPHLRLADPTLFRHGGLYWLACTDLDIGAHDNLCLLWARAVGGPWTAHTRWPVKIDVRGARPAGSPFAWGGALYRPAQDCAATYGAGVAIHRIEQLSPEAFSETLVQVLRPDPAGPFPDGLHTLVHDGERFWVDGKRFVLSPSAIGAKLADRVRRGRTATEAH